MVVIFFRCDTCAVRTVHQNIYQGIISENIQFHLFLTLHIGCAMLAQYVHKSCLAHLLVHYLSRKAYIPEQCRQFTGSLWEFPGFLDGKFIHGH